MSRKNDQYLSGQSPIPHRRASAQPGSRNQASAHVKIAQSSNYADKAASQSVMGVDDLLWYGACILLSLACIGTLAYWVWHIVTGQVDVTKLTTLISIVLIYILCVGGGWLWGMYQNAPVQAAQKQQIEELQQQIKILQQQVEYITREKYTLQQTMQQQGGTPTRMAPGQVEKFERVAPPQLKPQAGLPNVPAPPPGSIHEQQVEPADSRDLQIHPHEKRFPMSDEPNVLSYNWRLIGASRRGYGHGYEGKYREDDFQIKILNDPNAAGPALAIVAIADGLSSKGLSRKGALASVEGATTISEAEVAQLKTLLYHNNNAENLQIAAGNILQQALRNASTAVRHTARNEHVSIDELHATLLVFLAAPLGPDQLFLARVQIGDGAMFGVRSSANNGEPLKAHWKQLLAPQIQAAGNEVQPFMRSQEKDWYQFMQFDTLSEIAGVMAMTDGIADDIEPPAPTPGEPEPDLFSRVDLFHKTYVLPTLKSPRPADELVKFIGYRRSQSIDDRTLVYLYHK